MLPIRFLIVSAAFFIDFCIADCQDKSPYCNTNDCSVRPGYSMTYCRKTCGNCSDPCEDSKLITCGPERKKDCDEMLNDYCPKLCGKCTPKRSIVKRTKTIPVSQTSVTSTTARTIRLKQSKMLPNGTFISPPMPKYELDDSHTKNESHHVARMEEFLLPEPQRIWPEPEPQRIQPIYGYAPFPGSPPMGPSGLSIPIPMPEKLGYPQPIFESNRRASPPPFYLQPHNPLFEKYNIIVRNSMDQNLIEPFLSPPNEKEPTEKENRPSAQEMAKLISLLGCKDKDDSICKHITAETCLSRPGYYLKLCPITCKNCNGLQCIDSIKIDCGEVKSQGACKLAVAKEYCPRACGYCDPPRELSENLSPCKDELETCEQLAESGACEQEFSKSSLRIYCAKTCGFCKPPQFYFSDSPLQMEKRRNTFPRKSFIRH